VANKNAQIVRARSDITDSVSALAAMRDIDTVPAAVQSLMLTLSDAVPSVQDRLALFESMMSDSAFDGTYYNDTTSQQVYGALMAYLKIMSAATFSRDAVTASQSGTLAAQVLFQRGISALDGACLLASEHGNDALWESLEEFRETFTQTMLSQGLESIRTTWSFPSPLPALVMSNRIWQDAERADALVISASPVHPAFMPLSVEITDDTN
jgi:prophage DNA circulation protein